MTCVKMLKEWVWEEKKNKMPDSLLTHGLVLGGYGGGVVEDENVPFKLPARHGCLTGGQHHHPLPYLVPPHLKT